MMLGCDFRAQHVENISPNKGFVWFVTLRRSREFQFLLLL